MRILTKKQKTFLLKWANANPDLVKGFDVIENMEYEDWDKLLKMNDTEVLSQNCNRYLNDLELKTDPITQRDTYYENR